MSVRMTSFFHFGDDDQMVKLPPCVITTQANAKQNTVKTRVNAYFINKLLVADFQVYLENKIILSPERAVSSLHAVI